MADEADDINAPSVEVNRTQPYIVTASAPAVINIFTPGAPVAGRCLGDRI